MPIFTICVSLRICTLTYTNTFTLSPNLRLHPYKTFLLYIEHLIPSSSSINKQYYNGGCYL